jgi:hypothetical protein
MMATDPTRRLPSISEDLASIQRDAEISQGVGVNDRLASVARCVRHILDLLGTEVDAADARAAAQDAEIEKLRQQVTELRTMISGR